MVIRTAPFHAPPTEGIQADKNGTAKKWLSVLRLIEIPLGFDQTVLYAS
ncbi:hypothetical protein [Clostridium minihomine]|nr:hypothetical protein [Clostridium minihomine]